MSGARAKRPAVVLCPHGFGDDSGKVAHGLVRGSDRFEIVAVVDPDLAGRDAGEQLDGRARGVPIVAGLDAVEGPVGMAAIVGLAPFGGAFTPSLRALLLAAVERGWDVFNGLHHYLVDDPQIVARAAATGAALVDIRKPPSPKDLHFWTGAVHDIPCPIVAVLGTDCALGKRTTARILRDGLRARGVRAHVIFTGQTGWLQDGGYGFVLDSTPNDFVCGELEHAMLRCVAAEAPDVLILEGQAALRHPGGPCGAEFLVSGAADGVVLQHGPDRRDHTGFPGYRIASLASEIDLIAAYGVPTWAVTLNTGPDFDEADYVERQQARLGVPVLNPLKDAEPLVQAVLDGLQRVRLELGS